MLHASQTHITQENVFILIYKLLNDICGKHTFEWNKNVFPVIHLDLDGGSFRSVARMTQLMRRKKFSDYV